ncbi:hypothetical protein AAVH_16925 [Aphelenchoides avenae]|nr:hypothetical protein AAVH_16925 [Aphelenchus avenae]
MEKSVENVWKLKEDPLWAEDTPVFIAYSQDDPKTKILIATIAAMFLLDVICISFASYCIQSFLNEARRTMSRHTAKAHGQMTKVLYGQVVIPILAIFLPVIGGLAFMLIGELQGEGVGATIHCCMSMSAICVLNPIATIYFVPAYRNCVLSWLFPGPKQRTGTVNMPSQAEAKPKDAFVY